MKRVNAYVQCIEDTAIAVCMTGLLYALPNTQLTRRLLKEGRLYPDHDRSLADEDADQCTSGLNFRTLRPRQEVLADYRSVLDRVYAPAAYFARVRRVARQVDCSEKRFRMSFRPRLRDARSFVRMAWRMGVRDADVRRDFWATFIDCARCNPRALRYVGAMIALYLHFGPFARHISARLTVEIDAQSSSPEVLVPAAGAGACRPTSVRHPEAEQRRERVLGAGLRLRVFGRQTPPA